MWQRKDGYSMNITDVRVRKVNDEGKMKAVVSITFDEEFVVHDIKVIEGQNGLFIAMPSRKMGEGDFRDIAHPLRSETRNRIKEAIFTEYEKILENSAATSGGSSAHKEMAEVDEEVADEDDDPEDVANDLADEDADPEDAADEDAEDDDEEDEEED